MCGVQAERGGGAPPPPAAVGDARGSRSVSGLACPAVPGGFARSGVPDRGAGGVTGPPVKFGGDIRYEVGMKTDVIDVHTGGREAVQDITGACEEFAREKSGGGDGLLHVFVPHATAGVALMELGAGSDLDLLAALGELLPAANRWVHAHGSRGHGRSHVLPAFVAPYATLPVVGGRLALGTWQSVALVDLNVDNPERHVRLSYLG